MAVLLTLYFPLEIPHYVSTTGNNIEKSASSLKLHTPTHTHRFIP